MLNRQQINQIRVDHTNGLIEAESKVSLLINALSSLQDANKKLLEENNRLKKLNLEYSNVFRGELSTSTMEGISPQIQQSTSTNQITQSLNQNNLKRKLQMIDEHNNKKQNVEDYGPSVIPVYEDVLNEKNGLRGKGLVLSENLSSQQLQKIIDNADKNIIQVTFKHFIHVKNKLENIKNLLEVFPLLSILKFTDMRDTYFDFHTLALENFPQINTILISNFSPKVLLGLFYAEPSYFHVINATLLHVTTIFIGESVGDISYDQFVKFSNLIARVNEYRKKYDADFLKISINNAGMEKHFLSQMDNPVRNYNSEMIINIIKNQDCYIITNDYMNNRNSNNNQNVSDSELILPPISEDSIPQYAPFSTYLETLEIPTMSYYDANNNNNLFSLPTETNNTETDENLFSQEEGSDLTI